MGAEQQGCPLPDDPVLAEFAIAAGNTGTWMFIVDPGWRWVYMSEEAQISQSLGPGLAPIPLGEHFFSRESLESTVMSSRFKVSEMRSFLEAVGPWLLADIPGGRDELRQLVHPALAGAVDKIPETSERSAVVSFELDVAFFREEPVRVVATNQRVFDSEGRFRGVVLNAKPAVGMSVIATAVATGDLDHFERMRSVSKAGRQSAAILFADLEGSAQLSRRLSTAAYFDLGRSLVAAADTAVIQAGGIVGRHVGDGVAAFFLKEAAGSEARAAHACIAATRALRAAVSEVAARGGLGPGEVTLRFGLHWGSTLFMGLIATPGRSEVTALGDEVNEAARIEACATGGRALASKELIERLDPHAAADLGIDYQHVSYTALADLSSATEKARRDAPALAVCEV